MSGRTYARFLDTGFQWLGQIPSHWRQVPLWTVFRRTKRVGFGDEELLSVYRDYGVIPKSSRDDNFNKPSDDLSDYQLVEPGDLVINKMKAWQGSVGIAPFRGIVSPAYFVFLPTHSENPRYLSYLLRSAEYAAGYFSLSKGIRVNQWDVEPQGLRVMPIVLPSPAEQAAIAEFLDRETANIDALVAEQERLIALLEEKRQALISHAVTKGLDHNVPMKDSGVEWLGQVPAHWRVVPIKMIAKIGNGSTPNRDRIEYWDNPTVPWLTSTVVNQEEVSEASEFVSVTAVRDCHLPIVTPPAVLIGITGQGKTRGLAATLRFPAAVSQHIAYVVPLDRSAVDVCFLRRYFDMAYRRLREESDGGGSTRAAITCEQIGNLRVALPAVLEQASIVEYVSQRIEDLDRLEQDVVGAIDLLRERRSTLISSAITGKIDVRGLAA